MREARLRHELALAPDDNQARIALARWLRRQGEGKEATELLRAGEKRFAGELGQRNPQQDALEALQRARLELGLYHFAEARVRELLAWPRPKGLRLRWAHQAPPGWAWRHEALHLAEGILMVQRRRTGAMAGASLRAFDLAEGRELWQLSRQQDLHDLHLSDGAVWALWLGRGPSNLDRCELDSGKSIRQEVLEGKIWREGFVPLGDGSLAVARGEPGQDAQVAMLSRAQVEDPLGWGRLADHGALAEILAHVPRRSELSFDGLLLAQHLQQRHELLAAWRDTHHDEHLIYCWNLGKVRRNYALHNHLYRVREGQIEAIDLPQRWTHEPVMPRFFRMPQGWVGTLQYHQLKVQHGTGGLRVVPMGAMSQAAPSLWYLADDGQRVDDLPLGHAGGELALRSSGGAWWGLREKRAINYTLHGRTPSRPATEIALDGIHAEYSQPPKGWTRLPAAASMHLLPMGDQILSIAPKRLALYDLEQ